jgi:Na+/H+-dicarboxylate symporter
MQQHVSPNLTRNILLCLVLGVLVGSLLHLAPTGHWTDHYLTDNILDVGGKIFVKFLSMTVIPVVFVSLVYGTCELRDQSSIGKLATQTLFLYLITTVIAIVLALVFANLFGIGKQDIPLAHINYTATAAAPSFKETLLNMFPSNPLSAMVNGQMLQVIIFSLLFGVAIAYAGERGKPVVALFRSLNDVIMLLVIMLMNAAPLGVFCLVAHVFAKFGFYLFSQLASYFMTVVFVLLIHLVLMHSTMLSLLARLNPWHFYRKMFPAMLFAFSTSSSNASIPVVLETVRDKLGVPNFIASFSIPLGATINMDGTAIMQGVATVFIANLYHVQIDLAGYLTIVVMATFASVGTAGVPSAGLITLSMVLQQVGVPLQGIGIIIGIDRLLDMLRTAVNITGDAAVACVVAKNKKALDTDTYYAK